MVRISFFFVKWTNKSTLNWLNTTQDAFRLFIKQKEYGIHKLLQSTWRGK